jgi:uncharacterized protein YbjT (DUF2867 family)
VERVLVTGATGRVGGWVTEALKHRGIRPAVLVRDATSPNIPTDTEVHVGDFTDEDSLRAALDGVEAAFLVSPLHPDQRRLQSRFARVAAKTGAPLIVKLSGLGTALDSFVDSGRWHAEIEQDIRELGLPHTFLRPNFLMQNLQMPLREAARSGVIRSGAGEGAIAMVDVRDVADVAVAALLGEASLLNAAITPTCSEAVSYEEIAAAFATALGRDVRVERLSEAKTREALERAGMPRWHLEILLQFNRAFAAGSAAEVSDVVERFAGHPPRTLQGYVSDQVREGRLSG